MKEWCANINTSVLAKLAKQKSKHVSQAWIFATEQLIPCKGYQVVDFSKAEKSIKCATTRLVDLGLLLPYRDSASKFYLPREFAFASMEDGFVGIRMKKYAEINNLECTQ